MTVILVLINIVSYTFIEDIITFDAVNDSYSIAW